VVGFRGELDVFFRAGVDCWGGGGFWDWRRGLSSLRVVLCVVVRALGWVKFCLLGGAGCGAVLGFGGGWSWGGVLFALCMF